MKRVFIMITMALMATFTVAQNNEIELFQSMFQTEKKMLLMDYLQLSESEATAFWPIYAQFETERAEIAKKRIALINKYAEKFETMTDEDADVLAQESFKIRASQEKLQKTYYKKFKKAVGAKRAAQFVQFERFVNTSIDNELNSNIPLIGEKL